MKLGHCRDGRAERLVRISRNVEWRPKERHLRKNRFVKEPSSPRDLCVHTNIPKCLKIKLGLNGNC